MENRNEDGVEVEVEVGGSVLSAWGWVQGEAGGADRSVSALIKTPDVAAAPGEETKKRENAGGNVCPRRGKAAGNGAERQEWPVWAAFEDESSYIRSGGDLLRWTGLLTWSFRFYCL